MSRSDADDENQSMQLNKDSDDSGINFSADYRFYLGKENKHNAPRGVYIGPYYSFNHFDRKLSWSLNTTNFTGNANSDFELNIHSVGGELGYQFILWKRVSLDFVLFGPGVASYQAKTRLSTDLDAADQEELFQLINDFLAEKIPGYSFVIDDEEYEKSGTSSTTALGFRYMIHLGVCF
jgi:hypothetical protein